MKLEPIGNLVSRVSQCDPGALGKDWITYLDISSIDRESKQIIAPARIAAATAPSRARQQVRAEDVLVSTVRPNLNAVARVPRQLHDDIASTGFCVLRPSKNRVCPSYLFYFTQTDRFVSHLMRISTGASYPAVTDNDIFETQIPLPSLNEQQRIAEQLEQADRLRRTRRYALELSDSFLPAAFLELFGDPKHNEKCWEQVLWGDLVRISSGHAFKLKEYSHGGVRLLQIANVSFGQIDWSISAFLPEKCLVEYSDIVLQPGDLVIALNRPIIGPRIKFAVLREKDCPSILYQRVGKFNLKTNAMLQPFLCGFMSSNFFYHELKKRLAGSDQPYINPSDLESVPVPVPPIPLQQQFAALVARHERLRATQREALRQAEHLFQTLLHRAFGEGV